MKITIDNAEIECTIDEAMELLERLKARQSTVPYQGQPTWRRFPDSTAGYVISVGGTGYNRDCTGVVLWRGKPDRCLPSDTQYRKIIGSTYSPDITGDSVHNTWRR